METTQPENENLLWKRIREPFEADKPGIILRLLTTLFCFLSFLLPWVPSELNFTAKLALSRDTTTMSYLVPGLTTVLNLALLFLVLSPEKYKTLNLIGFVVSAIFSIVTPIYYGFIVESNWPGLYATENKTSAGMKCSYFAGVLSIVCLVYIAYSDK